MEQALSIFLAILCWCTTVFSLDLRMSTLLLNFWSAHSKRFFKILNNVHLIQNIFFFDSQVAASFFETAMNWSKISLGSWPLPKNLKCYTPNFSENWNLQFHKITDWFFSSAWVLFSKVLILNIFNLLLPSWF